MPVNDQEKPNDSSAEPDEGSEAISFAEFLESVPPSQRKAISGLWYARENLRMSEYPKYLLTPDIQLHCTSDLCNGIRVFRYDGDESALTKSASNFFLNYRCSNCKTATKTFALRVEISVGTAGVCTKFGEHPPFGPLTPTKLLTLFGKERDNFIKGRRCENQGLGIGAFSYYRRVVENQKKRILDEIIRVCERISAPDDMIKSLISAKKETQFSKAMFLVKDAIPDALLVNGHNPLTLLHTALSGGLHEGTDEECLNMAHDARVVLAELAERISQTLKDEAELNNAVSRLMNSRKDK